MFRTAIVIAAVATSATVATAAQNPAPKAPTAQAAPQAPAPVMAGATVTLKAVIQAIDSTNRLVTLKHTDGTLDTIYCGPEVQRFSELKVGDTVTFTYHEAVVFAIAKPGSPAPPAPASAMVRSGGDKPAAAMAHQATAVVTVLAIDAKVPSVTIQKEDGAKMSFKVENPKNIAGVKVGDKVQITYTQALAVTVK